MQHLAPEPPDPETRSPDHVATIALLVEALAPFALYAEQMVASGQWGYRDDCVRYGVKARGAHQVTYGDFRRAARVLREFERERRRSSARECGPVANEAQER
jgi:hypothetical protein